MAKKDKGGERVKKPNVFMRMAAKKKDKKKKKRERAKKPNIFVRIGRFIKQIIDELRKVVTPTGKELVLWALAVLIFVLLLMAFVTAMDLGLGKLTLWMFG